MFDPDTLDLLQEFVVESLDLLDAAEPKLVILQQASEKDGTVDQETMNAVFRLFHSMKGSAGMLNLTSITSVTHEAETLLDLVRKGKQPLTPVHVELFLQTVDLVRQILDKASTEHTDEGFETDISVLVKKLEEAIQGKFEVKAMVAPQNKAEKKAGTQTEKDTAAPASKKAKGKAGKQTAPEVESPQQLPEQSKDQKVEAESKVESAKEPDFEMPIDEEMIQRFVNESDELLETFEQSLLTLEKAKDEAALQQAFRAIHSFKGNCGFMGLVDLERLSHRMETALDGMKSHRIEVNQENVNILLRLIDTLRNTVVSFWKKEGATIANVDLYLDFLSESFSLDAPKPAVEIAPVKPKIEIEAVSKIETEVTTATVVAAPKEVSKQVPLSNEPPKTIVRQDIRVDLLKLDALINLVGELVIAEAMMTRHPSIMNLQEEGVERAIHQLRRVSRDLQDVAMSVRMIPLAATFHKMIRLVHDLSTKSGKKVNLTLLGEDTEVDKTVIEQIADPLVHIVRNAVDHGIESPEIRGQEGKVETGQVTIEGRHEGGEVWITISDDGRGLNREKILNKGVERGLVAGDGSDLSDSQIYKLIFEPGFSTADKVTDISGRGVGMDVVKKNLEKLRGRVDIFSTAGQGSKFILRIPLTMAIIEGMLVRVGQSCYTLPILAIRESFRPTNEQITVTPDGQEIVRIREELIPVVRLHEVFRTTPQFTELTEGILIILESEQQTVSLLVDEIIGQQETVIKGLSEYLGEARCVSGCTILGDGQVSLIVDVGALISSVVRA